MIAFASNDYLGLATHRNVKEASKEAIEKYGAGSGASRLITGSLPPHRRLEEQLAKFKGTEAALAFGSGYQTASSVIACLLTENDTLISDRLNHACLIDGARLSKATIKIFEHNDLDQLESILKVLADDQARQRHDPGNLLIVTESVFSMDGDQAPLAEIAALKNRYGAWLMVDEAHATGLYGPQGQGWAECTGTSHNIDIQMGTLGKAVGAAGGFISGSQMLIDFLVNRARSFIFSTAPTPASAAAAIAAIEIIQSAEGSALRARLWQRVRELRAGLEQPEPDPSPIVPLLIGSESQCLKIAAQLEAQGFLVPAIRYPSVPRNQARLRITLSAQHTQPHAVQLLQALSQIKATNIGHKVIESTPLSL